MTQRGSWSLVLLDRVSDSFSLAVFFIQFCFVESTRLHLNFFVQGHLIAASADVPFAISPFVSTSLSLQLDILTFASHRGTSIANSIPVSQSTLPIQSHIDWALLAFLFLKDST